jgi:uncharacterized protein YbjT (DUF2867 family)
MILITGATGNVGHAIFEQASRLKSNLKLAKAQHNQLDEKHAEEEVRYFDFFKPKTYLPALAGCEILFLIRPPQISDVKVFEPLMEAAQKADLNHLVFLSVQGAENNSFIPHYKIEKLIKASGIPYTFLRPAYFMENFLTQHFKEIMKNKRVFVPAGNAKFTLVSVKDIALVSLSVFDNPKDFKDQALTLTNGQLLTFKEMCQTLTSAIGQKIQFVSPNLIRFFWAKKRQGMPTAFILVMIMLHYLPRFSGPPQADETLKTVTGKPPITFGQFAQENASNWVNS